MEEVDHTKMGHAQRYNAPRTVETILADPKTYVPKFLAWKMRHPRSAVLVHIAKVPIELARGAWIGIRGAFRESKSTIGIYADIVRNPEIDLNKPKVYTSRYPVNPHCDHRFIDSKHCLKCGWIPK